MRRLIGLAGLTVELLVILVIVLPVLAAFGKGPFAREPKIVPADTNVTGPFTVQRDVTYCTMGDVPLLVDIYTPAAKTDHMPLVLYIHGGGWRDGSSGVVARGVFLPVLRNLTGAGYVVASVNYRLAPRYPFPAMIEDVKCAVRYFRASAAIYQIDRDHIGAWGTSAGGHLAALLGTAGPSAGWDVGQYLDQSSRVQAVVDWFGPADLTTLPKDPGYLLELLSVFGSLHPSVLATDSPVTYVHAGDSPFLIVQGREDETVPPAQSQELYDRLRAAGVPATLQWVDHAGHGLAASPPNATISPSIDALTQQMLAFLNANLR